MISKNIIPAVIIAIGIIIAGYFITEMISKTPSSAVQSIATRINPAPITTIVDRSPTILEGAKALGELTTYEMSFAKVGLEARLRFGLNYICEVKEKFAAQGTIRAGIDLQTMKIEFLENKYKITLPSPKFTGCDVKVDSYNRTGEIQFTCPADPEMYKFGIVTANTDFLDAAKERNIIEAAKQQAEVIVKGFAQSIAGETPIELTFEETDSTNLPESCKPQPPACWQYSGDASGWVKYC